MRLRISYITVIYLIPLLGNTQNVHRSHVRGSTKPKTQMDYEFKNILKLNSVSLAFSNMTLFYERAFYPKITGSLGIGYKFKGKSLALFSTNDNELKVHMDAIYGFSLAPEVRYYIKSCEDRIPAGFYTGLYFRYTNYSTGVSIDYNPLNGGHENLKGDMRLDEYGLGIQLGYQLAIKQRFVIDFQFFGPRYSFIKIQGDFENKLSEEFKNDMEEYVNEIIDRLGADYKFEIKGTGNHSISGRFQIPNIRFGISLGYAF
ncbi:MAG: DUF3575 domain-containing protein [Bacteroidales bacterium]|nr:DUF3575 domain-containing protein [Bacteroidales bacterium]